MQFCSESHEQCLRDTKDRNAKTDTKTNTCIRWHNEKKKLNQIICGVTDEIERWLTLFMSFSDKCPSIKKDFSSFSRKRYSEEWQAAIL